MGWDVAQLADGFLTFLKPWVDPRHLVKSGIMMKNVLLWMNT